MIGLSEPAWKAGDSITVRKLNLAGEEVWRYSGVVLETTSTLVRLEGYFNRPDLPFHGIILGTGDRFVEEYFADRWYNIFEIHDRLDDHLKGWYCNITYPAQFEGQGVAYTDLALDLLVFPDGRQLILDMEEFDLLPLTALDRQHSLDAMDKLQRFFRQKLTA